MVEDRAEITNLRIGLGTEVTSKLEEISKECGKDFLKSMALMGSCVFIGSLIGTREIIPSLLGLLAGLYGGSVIGQPYAEHRTIKRVRRLIEEHPEKTGNIRDYVAKTLYLSL